MRPRLPIGFFVLLASCAPLCLAQISGPNFPGSGPSGSARQTYSVDGTVRDAASGQSLDGVRVTLTVHGTPLGSTYSSNDGAFAFSGVPDGQYDIQAQADGYEPSTQSIEVARSPVFGVQVELSRTAGNAPSPSGPTVSVHQLGVPSKAQNEFDKGVTLMSSKADYRGAIAAFDRAIQDFADYYEAYALEGAAYEGLSDLPSAEKAMRKSIELSAGKYPVALYFLAALLSATNRFAEAEGLARQCIALDEPSWHGHFELAHALLGLRKLDEAQASADRARDLNPKNPQVYLLLADIDGARQDSTAFLQDLDGYLVLIPKGPTADRVRKKRDEVQQALRDSQTATPPPAPPAQQQ